MPQEVPRTLVITWYFLLTKSECPEARERAAAMLLGVFGSMKEVADYLITEKIVERP